MVARRESNLTWMPSVMKCREGNLASRRLLPNEKKTMKFISCQGFLKEKQLEHPSVLSFRIRTRNRTIIHTSKTITGQATPTMCMKKNTAFAIIVAVEEVQPAKQQAGSLPEQWQNKF